MNAKKIRPTKKQRELLSFIENFIAGNGYSPSYREIMKSLNYNSVATVALHVNSLIKRGHLRKRDKSARSLEVVKDSSKEGTLEAANSHQQWLVGEVEKRFSSLVKSAGEDSQKSIAEITTLINALAILGDAETSQKFAQKLEKDIQA